MNCNILIYELLYINYIIYQIYNYILMNYNISIKSRDAENNILLIRYAHS